MLFLLRPPQTRLPLSLPRDPQGQAEWNRLDLESYSSTRRLPPEQPSTLAQRDLGASLRDLAALHDDGSLTDEEFSRAKARLLATGDTPAT